MRLLPNLPKSIPTTKRNSVRSRLPCRSILVVTSCTRCFGPASPASGRPSGEIAARIKADFGSYERFAALFTSSCVKVQGTGWGALYIDSLSGALRVGSILDHTDRLVPGSQLVAVVDVWEHAYYLTYRNDRPTWVGAVIDHLDWDAIARRCDEAVVTVAVDA